MKRITKCFLYFLFLISLCSCNDNTNNPQIPDNEEIKETYEEIKAIDLYSKYTNAGGKATQIQFFDVLNTTQNEYVSIGTESPEKTKSTENIKYVDVLLWKYYIKENNQWNLVSNLMELKSKEEPEGVVTLDFYAINDFHGTVIDSENVPGIAKTSTFLKEKQKVEDTILLSSGDMWQGSSESNNTKGKLVTEWMNDLGFASMTVGNHEFDWSSEYVKTNSQLADFAMLGINVYSRTTNEKVDYCDASTVVEMNGAKVGIIGAIGDCYSSISSSMVEDIKFIVGKELTNLVKNEANRLKTEEDCDLIVYSYHDGVENYDIEISDYVDLVFEGHTHQNYIQQDSKGIYHVQAAGYNKKIGHVEIDLDLKTNDFKVNQIEALNTSEFMNLDEDAFANSLFDKYADEIGSVHEVLGYNSKYRSSTELEQLVADLYLEKGLEKWSSKYNIVLGGGFIKTRSPYDLEKGDVTYSMLQTIFPFDNNLVLCKVSGSKLLSQFINTSNLDYFITFSEYGNSIKSSISSSQTYYIVVDTYTSDYAYNGLTVVDTFDVSGYYARDMLAEYAKAGKFETGAVANLNHKGTIEDPYDISDAIKLANSAGGKNDPNTGYFKVYVSDISSIKTGYTGDLGNFYVTDESGKTMYVYYLSKYQNASSSNNWNGSSELKVGDELIIYGIVYVYNGSPQFGSGNYCISINGKNV